MSAYLAVLSFFSFLLLARGEVLNLVDPPNYADQPVPDYIEQPNTALDNPITDRGALLGRVLFYDRRLSSNDKVSCASCHQQQHAFSDPDDFSAGVNGLTNRRSMRLINIGFSHGNQMFWDRRVGSLEELTTRPVRDHIEMGNSGQGKQPTFQDLLAKLSLIKEYRILFTAVFGDPSVTERRMQLAMAQFVRSIQSFDSLYDIGRAMVTSDLEDFPNFTEIEQGETAFQRSSFWGRKRRRRLR